MKFIQLLSVITLLLFSTEIIAQEQSPDLSTREVIGQLELPWEILWGPDDHIWFTERKGKISRINPQTGESQLLLTIENVGFEHESGLLGMVLHPDFKNFPFVYVAHTYHTDGSNDGMREKIVRYTYVDSTLSDPLIVLDNLKGNTTHVGCRLVIAPDMTMFISTGDAGNWELPLYLKSLSGKILRINLDGTIPEDNPFPGSAIWSFGHRNPQGLVLSPHGILYSSEHGPFNDDEVNIITKAANYGWPTVEGFCNKKEELQFCLDNAVNEPIAAWTPTVAVCGMDYYDNPLIPDWSNSLLLANLKGSQVLLLKLDETGTKVIEQKKAIDGFGRVRDICIAPNGKVYICTSNGVNDKIIEIEPKITSISETEIKLPDYKIYPNPTSGASSIEFSLLKPENVEVDIYNALGEKFSTIFKGFRDSGYNTLALDMSAYPAGAYSCRIIVGTHITSLPFIHTP